MKTPARILIVAALAAAVAAALALKQNKTRDGSTRLDPAATAAVIQAEATVAPGAARKLPRLLDLGAGKCIPCKMMAPILEELRRDYAGKLEVEFIDVWEDPEVAKSFGVEVIPTQIFYDPEGNELFRHVGFFGKEDILGKWKELGVELAGMPGSNKTPTGRDATEPANKD